MNKILFVLLLTIPFQLKAQVNRDGDIGEFRPGLTKSNLRAFYEKQPQDFKIILETDTLDSFSFQGMMRINCFYKNDTCYKSQQIFPFDHREIKNMAHDSYKQIAKNIWVKSDGMVEMKITVDESKDVCIMEATINPKLKK